jgi:hypothetical protein
MGEMNDMGGSMSRGARREVWVAALALACCGRLGYDASDGAIGSDGATDDAGEVDAEPTATPDYCAGIPPLPVAPVIDGQLEPGLALAPLVPVGWQGGGDGVPEGQSAVYAVAWRPDGLYFYVRVTDPSRLPARPDHYVWCGDGVEVYVDDDGRYPNAPAYDNPGTRQFITVAPADDDAPARRGQAFCLGCGDAFPVELTSTDFLAVPTPDGYALERFVVAGDLGLAAWSLASGAQVGFDLGINVSHEEPRDSPCGSGVGDGHRLGNYFLRVLDESPRRPWGNAAAFCTASLE